MHDNKKYHCKVIEDVFHRSDEIYEIAAAIY